MKNSVARLFLRLGRPKEALVWAQDKILKARALINMRRYKKAIDILDTLTPKNPQALWIKIKILRRIDRDEEAWELMKQFIKIFPRDKRIYEALWRLGFGELEKGNKRNALKYLRELAESDAPETLKSRALYFIFLMNPSKKTLKKLEGAKLETILYLAKLYREGKHKLKFKMDSKKSNKNDGKNGNYRVIEDTENLRWSKIVGLTELMNYSDNVEVRRFIERLILMELVKMSEYGTAKELAPKLAKIGLYKMAWRYFGYRPIGFKDIVSRMAQINRLPKSLVFGVILAESEFDQYAISPAGAVGLMQIMPSTGKRIFKHFKEQNSPDSEEDFSEVFLFDSEINITFGTFYLRKLIDTFGGNILLALAAYNGGPNNVKRWFSDFLSSPVAGFPEVFIEGIPFRETRFYVKKVIKYWFEYAKTLGEELDLKSIFKLK
jgi:soluble lytic murein transglycosylase